MLKVNQNFQINFSNPSCSSVHFPTVPNIRSFAKEITNTLFAADLLRFEQTKAHLGNGAFSYVGVLIKLSVLRSCAMKCWRRAHVRA